jgi:hypothetical protein
MFVAKVIQTLASIFQGVIHNLRAAGNVLFMVVLHAGDLGQVFRYSDAKLTDVIFFRVLFIKDLLEQLYEVFVAGYLAGWACNRF